MDAFFSTIPSLRGNKMAQLYINDQQFSCIYPMKHKSDVSDTLATLIHEIGIPNAIHSDDAKELTQGHFKQMHKR
jgi:hypothetical protein